jgi:hypothetical protein
VADVVADPGEDQGALLHDQRPIGVRQYPDVLLDDDHRDPVVVDPLHDLEHRLGQRRAEPEGGLVDEQQPRAGHQRPADGEHLLLATGQGPRGLIGPFGEPREVLEDEVTALLDLVAAPAPRPGAEPEVVGDAERREHPPTFRHHRDPGPHQLRR